MRRFRNDVKYQLVVTQITLMTSTYEVMSSVANSPETNEQTQLKHKPETNQILM